MNIVLKEQRKADEGDYCYNLKPVASKNFAITFGQRWGEIVIRSLPLLREIKRPGRMQVLTCDDTEFWVISSCEKSDVEEYMEYDTPTVTFILPEDY